MAKEAWINIKYVQRLVKRFTLQDYKQKPEAYSLGNQVVPVTQVDALLSLTLVYAATVAVGAGGLLVSLTVPLGKRWQAFSFEAAKLTGDYSFTGLYIGDGAEIIQVVKWSGAGTQVTSFNGAVLPLEEGWTFQVYIGAYVGAGNAKFKVLVKEEKAF